MKGIVGIVTTALAVLALCEPPFAEGKSHYHGFVKDIGDRNNRHGFIKEMGDVKVSIEKAQGEYLFEEALLDHEAEIGTSSFWSQRVFVNDTYWGGDGYPVYVYIGGEGGGESPSGTNSNRLFYAHMARKHKALMIAVEHRFYGESQPTSDMSVENLKYLTSEQALGDLARVVSRIRQLQKGVADNGFTPSLTLKFAISKSKWVCFGGSYPGALAAWFRLKYPGLVDGAIASSAPVQPEMSFSQYANVVGHTLGLGEIGGSRGCYRTIEMGVNVLVERAEKAFEANAFDNFNSTVPSSLSACEDFTKSNLTFSSYLTNVYSNFQGVAQYNGLAYAGATIKNICEAALEQGVPSTNDEAIEALGRAVHNITASGTESTCIEDDTITFFKELQNTTFETDCAPKCSFYRQWIWQSCNEFGYFQTTTGTNQPFSAIGQWGNWRFVGKALCENSFGFDYPDKLYGLQTTRTTTRYQARAAQSTRVTYVNGGVDPWHALSVVPRSNKFYESCNLLPRELQEPQSCPKQAHSKANEVVFINGGSHCLDMYAPSVTPEFLIPKTVARQIRKAHRRIERSIRRYTATKSD